jgi:hypothetical protein
MYAGDWLTEVWVFGIEPRLPGGYPTIPTPVNELSNSIAYLVAIPVEIKKKFFEPAQLLGLVVLSHLIWMGNDHYPSIRFSELLSIRVSIKWVESKGVEYVYLLRVTEIYADHFGSCLHPAELDCGLDDSHITSLLNV